VVAEWPAEAARGAAGAAVAVPPAPETTPPTGDRCSLRAVLGTFATGVTVVSVGGRVPHGMTANSFASVSLDPPLVLVCVGRDAVMHDSMLAAESFAVSVLGAHQEAIARHFADRSRPRGLAQFDPVQWSAGMCTGAPLIQTALAWLECRLWRAYDGGDHSIFLGRVLSACGQGTQAALVFFGGRFRHLAAEQPESRSRPPPGGQDAILI
jgi:flavin reductase (DIM6/NTAB) family NADH-FMN oxidoreductase RutF